MKIQTYTYTKTILNRKTFLYMRAKRISFLFSLRNEEEMRKKKRKKLIIKTAKFKFTFSKFILNKHEQVKDIVL